MLFILGKPKKAAKVVAKKAEPKKVDAVASEKPVVKKVVKKSVKSSASKISK